MRAHTHTHGHTIHSEERLHRAQFAQFRTALAANQDSEKQSRSTIVKLEVVLGNKGVGSPYNHPVDQVGVLRCCNQSADSSVTPPQQRELAKAQCLPMK